MSAVNTGLATCVLLVEDEAFLRIDALQFLQEEGFIVIESHNGEHAATVIGSHPHIHVLFTDVHLGGDLNGVQLAHLARKRWPSIAILIVSGRGQPEQEEMPSGSRFLPKPYAPQVVVRHLRELVAQD